MWAVQSTFSIACCASARNRGLELKSVSFKRNAMPGRRCQSHCFASGCKAGYQWTKDGQLSFAVLKSAVAVGKEFAQTGVRRNPFSMRVKFSPFVARCGTNFASNFFSRQKLCSKTIVNVMLLAKLQLSCGIGCSQHSDELTAGHSKVLCFN